MYVYIDVYIYTHVCIIPAPPKALYDTTNRVHERFEWRHVGDVGVVCVLFMPVLGRVFGLRKFGCFGV